MGSVVTSALEALLKAGEWRAADEETRRLLLTAADRGGFTGLDPGEVATLDCSLLVAIDRVWHKASAGRFGFAVQSEILSDVRGAEYRPKKTWRLFGTRVGWRDGRWVEADELAYTIDAEPGHLPWVPGTLPTVATGPTYEVFFLFYQQFDECKAT
jgi:hypothetical protein